MTGTTLERRSEMSASTARKTITGLLVALGAVACVGGSSSAPGPASADVVVGTRDPSATVGPRGSTASAGRDDPRPRAEAASKRCVNDLALGYATQRQRINEAQRDTDDVLVRALCVELAKSPPDPDKVAKLVEARRTQAADWQAAGTPFIVGSKRTVRACVQLSDRARPVVEGDPPNGAAIADEIEADLAAMEARFAKEKGDADRFLEAQEAMRKTLRDDHLRVIAPAALGCR